MKELTENPAIYLRIDHPCGRALYLNLMDPGDSLTFFRDPDSKETTTVCPKCGRSLLTDPGFIQKTRKMLRRAMKWKDSPESGEDKIGETVKFPPYLVLGAK